MSNRMAIISFLQLAHMSISIPAPTNTLQYYSYYWCYHYKRVHAPNDPARVQPIILQGKCCMERIRKIHEKTSDVCYNVT